MLRVCTESDRTILDTYLKKEPYGQVILAAVEQFGFHEKFQTVYIDTERICDENEERPVEEIIKGVYLLYHRHLLLYSESNQVATDFLEQQIFMEAPVKVIGRPDNVNIVSWLLTDYKREEQAEFPEVTDENGAVPDCFKNREEYCGQWLQLKGEKES